jgi:hypothetical protein
MVCAVPFRAVRFDERPLSVLPPAGVFLGHHSRGDWTDVRFRIPVRNRLLVDDRGLSFFRLPGSSAGCGRSGL